MANLDLIKGRQVVASLTNNTGGAVAEGDVVFLDSANPGSFDDTVVAGLDTDWLGVVQETIANGADGRVCIMGYVAKVTLSGAAALGDYIKTTNVAKQGVATGTRDVGTFGQVLAANAAPPAIVWGNPQVAAAGAAPNDYPYLGFGTDGDLSAEVDITAAELTNEMMNFPKMEGTLSTLPYWWSQSANATTTEVDTSGEAITDSWERCLKVVTTATPRYAYQRYTYADQPRLKLGKTVSAIFAVWSVGAAAARIRLQSSVGSLGVSADTVAAAWTILAVNGVVLDGTYVDIRCEVDSGTAYFVPLGLHVGARGIPLKPRPLKYISKGTETVAHDLNGAAAQARTDLDLTAATSALACMADVLAIVKESGAGEFGYHVYPNNWPAGAAQESQRRGWVNVSKCEISTNNFVIILDDGQVLEDELTTWAGGTPDICRLYLNGWWEWA